MIDDQHTKVTAAGGPEPSIPADEPEAHSPQEYLEQLQVVSGSPTPEDLSAIASALSLAERERHREQRKRAIESHEPEPSWREKQRSARRDRQLY